MKAMWICALPLLLAGGAGAADAYRCAGRNGVTYTDVPCAGGREVGSRSSSLAPTRHPEPPQDRAKLANRARLEPDTRRACEALEGELKQQEAFLRTRGGSATADEERPLVQGKLRFRELRC